MEQTIPTIMQWDENFDIGADTGTPVDDADYQVPFRFTGKLDKLTLTIDRPKRRRRTSQAQASHAQQSRGRVASPNRARAARYLVHLNQRALCILRVKSLN